MKTNSVYIIIVTYNAETWIPFFAPPLEKLPERWRVVVIDNGSTDDGLTILKENYPQFQVIANEANLGFGAANNIGMSLAIQEGADYVFLLNQDARIVPEDIKKLVEVQKRHPECLIVSPIHLDGPGDEMDASFASYCAPAYCPSLYRDALKGELQEVYHATLGNAAAWLLSRECLCRIGGFNPLFFLYGEDDDYRNRVISHGYRLGVVPAAFAMHDRASREYDPVKYRIPGLLANFLDIRRECEIDEYVKRRKSEIRRDLTRLKVKKAWRGLREIRFFKNLRQDILTSREKTQKEGSTFLSELKTYEPFRKDLPATPCREIVARRTRFAVERQLQA
jgi:GT2 family glycosyltransferase